MKILVATGGRSPRSLLGFEEGRMMKSLGPVVRPDGRESCQRSGCCGIDGALNLFSEMITRGIAPNVITYNSLIDGVSRLGGWKEALRLLNEMVSNNVLVDALCKEGMVLDAQIVVQMMIQRDIEPNTVTYKSLMDGYCLRGETNQAKTVFDLMVSKDFMVDSLSCNILINEYCKHKNIDETNKVFQEMPLRELVPDTITYTSLIDGFCKAEKLMACLATKKQRSCSVRCKSVANFQIFKLTLFYLMAYVASSNFLKAIELLREMEANKLELDIVVYTVIIEGLCKTGNIEYARELFYGLSTKQLQPDVRTYKVMIHELCKGGLIEAEKLIREMEEKVCSPNVWTYNIMIHGCIDNNAISRAMGHIQQMVERGFSADASTVELIIDLLFEDREDPALLPLLKNS